MKTSLCTLIILLFFPVLPALIAQENTVPGVTLRTYLLDVEPDKLPVLVDGQTPNVDRVHDKLDWSKDALPDLGGPTYSTATGFLVVENGRYRFRLTSDDGSRLRVGGRVVCDHDGRHGATARAGKVIQLQGGSHTLFLEHFDGGGNRRLLVEWKRAGAKGWKVLGGTALRTDDDPTRVTSPGPKRIVGQKRPGDRRPLRDVHPSWRVETIRPDGFKPKVGALAFLPDGRLLVGTFDPLQRDEIKLPDINKKEPDKLFAISGLASSDPDDWKVEVIGEGFYEPAGACVVGNDVYVAQRGRVTRISDADGDGFYEKKHDVASGWEGWNYHQFSLGLVHREGKLYTALSTAMAPPAWTGMGTNAGPNGPMQGSVVEIDLSSDTARIFAGGLRTPNGLGLGPEKSLFYADNQGTWMSTSQLAEVIEGRFYGHYNRTDFVPKLADRYPDGGHPSAFCDRLRTPPTAWLPQNEVVNSPTTPLLIEDGEFAGQLLLGELTAGGIRRVFLDRVNGSYQGALFRHTQGLEAGVNRMVKGPDGALYLGCIGAGGNWNWKGTQYGLQRLVPTGKTAFEMKAVSALPEGRGFRVTFTRPVAEEWLADPAHFTLSQWRYEHTAKYGGPKIDVESLQVVSTTAAKDGRSVRIRVKGLKEGRCVHILCDPVSTSGERIRSTEAWYTMNQFPRKQPANATIAGKPIAPQAVGLGILPPAGASQLMGKSSHALFKRGVNGSVPGRGRNSQKDLLRMATDVAVNKITGDLVTVAHLGDCRLHVEWFAPRGGAGENAGNSGIYLQDRYEIQVLSTAAGKKRLELWDAGSIYRVRTASQNASSGPGTWQAYDIWFRAPRFVDGKKTEDARITLYWNGVLVQDDVPIKEPTGARRRRGEDASRPVQVGPLLLQHHANNAKGPVRYRNIWVAPLDDATYEEGPWQNLLAGEGFEDFSIVGGKAVYRREGGVVVGTTRPNTPNTFLTTKKSYRDFDLAFEVKLDPELNSGVQIRSKDIQVGLQGYQIEIDPSPRLYSAGIYDERRRGWLHTLLDAPYAQRAWRWGGWNRIEVEARGPRIRTWINGVPASDLHDAMTAEGRIGLQVHGVGGRVRPLEVRWRHLRIREVRRRSE